MKILVFLTVLFAVALIFLAIIVRKLSIKNKQLEELQTELRNKNSTLSLKIQQETKQLEQLGVEYKELSEKMTTHESNLKKLLSSNIEAIPWLAGMMADFLTYDLELLAKKLDWGYDVKREKKVASIREIRKDAKSRIEEAKIAIYQLEYLKTLFPGLSDVLESDYTTLEFRGKIPEHDVVRDYLSKEEWYALSTPQRNQLALDRYIQSRSKSKWQIGRDYELSVAYQYSCHGFEVDTFGSYMGLEDLGRDLIVKRGNNIQIIQCKYWSQKKEIHEKHLFQLYGTVVSYTIENDSQPNTVIGVFVTNTTLSYMAKLCAKRLGIIVRENFPLKDYPRIKCNIGKDEFGRKTKIYHLPMDQQYDAAKIDQAGEFYAFTVAEAEARGFRRAYKWYPS